MREKTMICILKLIKGHLRQLKIEKNGLMCHIIYRNVLKYKIGEIYEGIFERVLLKRHKTVQLKITY